MNGLGWGVRSLGRHRLRTVLSVLGIAVAAAMLLDMVMLSGGIDKSFAELLLGRGFQIRITPKGTLPFDTEASMPGATRLLEGIRSDPDVELAGAVLGTPLFGRGRGLTGYALRLRYRARGAGALPGHRRQPISDRPTPPACL